MAAAFTTTNLLERETPGQEQGPSKPSLSICERNLQPAGRASWEQRDVGRDAQPGFPKHSKLLLTSEVKEMILRSVFSACLSPLDFTMNFTALEGKSIRAKINKKRNYGVSGSQPQNHMAAMKIEIQTSLCSFRFYLVSSPGWDSLFLLSLISPPCLYRRLPSPQIKKEISGSQAFWDGAIWTPLYIKATQRLSIRLCMLYSIPLLN